MSLRTAALRLPLARVMGRRFNSAVAASGPGVTKVSPLKDPHLPPGVEAYEMVFPPAHELPQTDFLKRRLASAAHAEGTTDLWRKISFYICFPAIVVTAIWVWKLEEAHEAHHAHLVELNGGEEPERKVYSYMNIKTKPYPWGHQSLFFNPKVNIPIEE